MAVQGQRVLGNIETALQRDLVLALLDLFVVELFHPSAIQADQMVVMRTGIEFKYGLAGFEMVTVQQASLLELRQHAVHSCQTDIHIFCQ